MITEVLEAQLTRLGDSPAGRLGIAVSGGADSMALLEAAAEARPAGTHVLHVDHGMRPDSSADAAFVADAAAARGLGWTILRVRVERTSGMSPEEAAREVRYAALERAAAELGCGAVATAHTLDDQAETVLMRLLRGSGGGGLSGIPAKRGRFIRPFLDLRRADLHAWLLQRGVAHREDPTNADASGERNWIRRELMPLLERRRQGTTVALARSARLVAEDSAYLEELASERMDLLHLDAFGAYLPTEVLAAPRPIASRVVRRGFAWAGVDATERDVGRALELLEAATGRFSASGDTSVHRLPGGLAILPAEPRRPAAAKLPDRGEGALPGWRIRLRVGGDPAAPGWRWRCVVPGGEELWIRSRRPGDRVPTGAGTKKIQDVLVDSKVPRVLRDLVPVLVRGGEPVAVVGCTTPPVGWASGHTEAVVVDAEPLEGGWWKETGLWNPQTLRATS